MISTLPGVVSLFFSIHMDMGQKQLLSCLDLACRWMHPALTHGLLVAGAFRED